MTSKQSGHLKKNLQCNSSMKVSNLMVKGMKLPPLEERTHRVERELQPSIQKTVKS